MLLAMPLWTWGGFIVTRRSVLLVTSQVNKMSRDSQVRPTLPREATHPMYFLPPSQRTALPVSNPHSADYVQFTASSIT